LVVVSTDCFEFLPDLYRVTPLDVPENEHICHAAPFPIVKTSAVANSRMKPALILLGGLLRRL
jgi:hypothetical protein